MAPRPDDPDDAAPAPGADAPRDGAPHDHEPTDDERWAQIVAELGELDALDDLDAYTALEEGTPTRTEDVRVVRPAERADPPAELSGRDWDGTAQYDDAEATVDAHDHFVPPDPGPVLGGDPLLTMAWFAAAGMPVFLLLVLIFWQDAPIALVQAAALVFVIGVAVLVWRMPQRRDPDDHDPDNGAVV
jgi:hypothetical protein